MGRQCASIILVVMLLITRGGRAEGMKPCQSLEPDKNGKWGPESPAAAWLAALQFDVPQVNETVVGGLDVMLGPLTCSGVSIRTLQSRVIEPNDADGVQVNAGGVEGQCNGPIRYHYRFVNGGGDLHVNVAGADARAGVVLEQNASSSVSSSTLISTFMPPPTPTLPSLRLSCCSASLAEVDISLSGGAALDVLNMFRDAIAALVKREVSAAACVAIQSVVNKTLTNVFHHGVEETIEPFVDAGEKFNISGAALIDGTRDEGTDAFGTSGRRRKGRAATVGRLVDGSEHREQTQEVKEEKEEEEERTVNMEINPMMRALEVVVAILASDSMSMFSLEYFVELVTNAAGNGSADVPASLLERNFTLPVADYGNITMTVHGIDIDGLDSVEMPYGLHAVSADTANVSVRIDRVDAYANVSIAVAPENSKSINGTVLKEDFEVHVDARNVTTSTALLLKLAEEPLSKLTFDDMNMPCIARTVVEAAVPYVDASMYVENMTLTPMSSKHGGVGVLEESLDAVINDVLEVATHNFEEAIHYGIIGVSTELLQERLNETLVNTVSRVATESCLADSNVNISPIKKYGAVPQVTLVASCVCWALALLLACSSAAMSALRDGYQWRGAVAVVDATSGGEEEEGEAIMGGAGIGGGQGLNEALMRDERESPLHGVLVDGEGSTAKYLSFALPPEDAAVGSGRRGGETLLDHGDGMGDFGDEGDGNGRIRPRRASSRSLARKVTSSFVLSFALSVLGTIFLFISSNTSLGANVMAVVTVEAADDKDSKYVNLPPLFQFTLENSVRDMWDAKVYSLALLIAIFSGTWPYVKLLTLLIVPFLPPQSLSSRWRARVLGTVDYLGKWSLIDAFVMMLFIVTFKMNISAHATSIGEAAFLIYVSPQRGFYLFLLATVLSLVLGHIAVYVNREVTSTAPVRRGLYGVSRATASILGHFTSTDAARERERLILVLSGFTLVVAFFVKFVKFEIKGLAGMVLGHAASRLYAIETLTSTVMGMHWPGQEIREVVGLYMATLSFLLFTLVMPLVQFASLYALAAKRHMRLETIERLVYISEISGTWSSLDVFSVSILAAVTQIEPFSQFIVGKKCDLVNSFIRMYLGELMSESVCFNVKAHFVPGFAVLVVAAALSLVVGHCGTVLARRRVIDVITS